MVRAQSIQTVACTPDEFLEFVMDIERYAKVDEKSMGLVCAEPGLDGASREAN
jgi:hypothetical protein